MDNRPAGSPDNRRKWNRFLSCVLGTGLVLLPLALLVLPAGASVQSMPAAETASWSFDNNVTVRTWTNNTSCTSYSMATNNTTPGDCTGYAGNWSWSCDGPATYLYEPGNYSMAVDDRDRLGLARNITMNGSWVLEDAGKQALAGQSAFNQGYCLAGGNASAADITSMQSEMATIGLAVLQGKSLHYTPVPQGSAWTLDATTGAMSNGQRRFDAKAGNHSVLLKANSASSFAGGVLNNTSYSASDSALELNSTPTTVNLLYHLDETGGTVAYNNASNTSVTNTSGYVNGSLVTPGNSTAMFGKSWYLGQTAGAIHLNHSNALNGGYFTAEAWFWFNNVAGNMFLFDAGWNGGNSPSGWGLLTDGSAHPRFDIDGQTGCTATNFTFSPGQWYFVNVRGDPNGLALAINGSHVESCATARYLSSSYGFTIGGCEDEACGVAPSVSYGFTGNIDDFRYSVSLVNTTTPTAPMSGGGYDLNGTWTSQVFATAVSPGSPQIPFWINYTNVSTMAGGTGMAWETRLSNTSFAQADPTPAWSAISNGSLSGVANVLGTYATYAQFRVSMWPDSTLGSTPKLTSFTANWTGLPVQTSALTANVTYAAPGEVVLIGVPYTDNESGVARVGDLRNSTTSLCTNATSGTNNSTAYCAFSWGATADGVAETLTPSLVDDDGAANTTNGSAPVTTDSAPPVISLDPIANTSTGSFTLNLAGKDNASGTNRTWFDLTNLSNGTYVGNYTNYTWTSNGSITLCATCTGQITVSAQSDDSLAAAWRHIAARSNVSFWFVPVPTLGTPDVSLPVFSDYGTVSATVTASAPGSGRVSGAWVWITDAAGTGKNLSLSLASGSATSGTWSRSIRLSDYFPSSDGSSTFQVQVVATDVSTTDLGKSANASLSYSVGGGGLAQTAAGAGGGTSSAALPATTFAAPKASPSPGQIACPSEIDSYLWILPGAGGNATWSRECRIVSAEPVSTCSILGERVNGNGSLTGQVDGWWSCDSGGGDSITFRYSVPLDRIGYAFGGWTREPSWNTFARVTANGSTEAFQLTAKLHVVNWAAPLNLPFPPGPLALLTPFALPALILGLLLAGVPIFTSASKGTVGLLMVAGAAVILLGVVSPEGGILGLWVWWGLLAAAVKLIEAGSRNQAAEEWRDKLKRSVEGRG